MEEQGMGLVAGLAKPTVDAIGKGIAESLRRQFNYLCCFSDNIKSLREEAKSLEDERAELQGKVDVAHSNAQVILPKVETWFTKMGELNAKKGEIEAAIANSQSHCLNIRSRYSLSRKAKDTAEAMKLLIDRSKFDSIAQPPPSASKTPIQLKETLPLQSRKDIEDRIVNFLASPGSHKVGIGGMGGLGKTTMGDKIMHRMLTENLVDEAIKVVVAQQPDVLKLQLQMAEQLGFTDLAKWKTQQEWARQLFTRLTSKRILIVLDDVWTTLNLGDLGIPGEGDSGGCSIILTSRDAEVLNQMDAQLFAMEILDESEAWSLFKDKAGPCVDDPNLVSIAEEVAKECKGLPVAIITVGSALKHKKDKPFWKDALRQLKSANPDNMPNVLKEVYTPLRFSYNFLRDHGKSLFLLCSIFPDDFEISINDLALYSMGLKMFEGVDSMEAVRDRVFTQVKELKSRFLLLDCDDKNKVKMHDVIRDVAIFIAKEQGLLGAKLGSEGHFDRNCEWISVFSSSTDESFDHLGESSFPSLRLLAIHQISLQFWEDRELKIGDISLLEGMQGLNVLSLRKGSFKSLGKSGALPKNLRTLRLEHCSLKSLSFAGALLNLEILSCFGCREIEELPAEIGNLRHLKLLDLTRCSGIERIAAGVIAKLVELEELKMLGSFHGWESSKVKEGDTRNVGLEELQSLHKLRCLEIQIKDEELAEEEIRLSPKIVKYAIFIGSINHFFDEGKSEKVLSLCGFPRNTSWGWVKSENCHANTTKFASWIHEFASSAEEIYLEGDGSINLDLSQVYNTITRLEIQNCGMLEEVAKTSTNSNVEGSTCLFKRPNQDASFSRLRRIRIYECNKLRNLFSLPRTNDGIFLLPQQLEELEIRDCEMMEEVVLLNEENEENNGRASGIGTIQFPKLVKLKLNNMSMLTAVVRGAEMIEFPLLEELRIWNCPKFKSIECGKGRGSDDRHNNDDDDQSLHLICPKKFDALKELAIIGGEHVISSLWCQRIPHHFFEALEVLEIYNYQNIKNLFSSSMVENFVNLRKLDISKCGKMEQVIMIDDKLRDEISKEKRGRIRKQKEQNDDNDGGGNKHHITLSFPKLRELYLESLPNLTCFGKGMESIEFLMLEFLRIEGCPELIGMVVPSKKSKNNDNEEMEEGHDDENSHLLCNHKVKISALETIFLEDCNNLRSLFSCTIAKNLVNFKRLSVRTCGQVEKVITGEKDIHESSTLFPSLESIKFEDLDSLRMFCAWKDSLEWPCLEQISIKGCPKMEFLTPGSLSIPKLCKIYIHEKRIVGEEMNKMKDLNIFLHHHIMTMGKEYIAPVVEHGETSKKNMDEIDEQEQT